MLTRAGVSWAYEDRNGRDVDVYFTINFMEIDGVVHIESVVDDNSTGDTYTDVNAYLLSEYNLDSLDEAKLIDLYYNHSRQ